MARRGKQHSTVESALPALYAHVHPGLEPIAVDEITRDLGGEVKRTHRGTVAFRVSSIEPKLLQLRVTEDVYLLAWGTDSLQYTAEDLKTIRTWTARKPDWNQLLKIHHAIRPLKKGVKPTFRIICQLQGEHGYRRTDAREAFAAGLANVIPNGWYPAEENAWCEFWLTIKGNSATCGVRLTDRTMRHREYKTEHVIASLRPTVAAAMARLASPAPGMTIIDPMCGAGTILAELGDLAGRRRITDAVILGGDLDPNAVHCTKENLNRFARVPVVRWDATRLPLADASVDRIVSNPPFGEQLLTKSIIGPLYRLMVKEYDRVLKPGGRSVILVSEQEIFNESAKLVDWIPNRQLKMRILGLPAVIGVWQKPFGPDIIERK
ncbi:MAG: methyltransferase domain-containing protein [Gemmataceae bacterium]